MKISVLILLTCMSLVACKKKSSYQCSCDIYGVAGWTYLPYGPLAKFDNIYSNVTEDEAEDNCYLFEQKYKSEMNDTFSVIKLSYPKAFISSSLDDLKD